MAHSEGLHAEDMGQTPNPREIDLDVSRLASPSKLYAGRHEGEPYMPMTRGDFSSIDPRSVGPEGWRSYMAMKVRMVRSRNETPKAREYFNNIEAAYHEAFETITPNLLADRAKMNRIICVDPHTNRQLEELPFRPDEEVKAPGGLGYLEVTGLLSAWLVPRIFNEQLAAGMHPNCGGFAILGALTGERQAMMRDRTESNVRRVAAEIASTIRNTYLQRHGHNFDPEGAEALADFVGPSLTIGIGSAGTAAPFVTPKSLYNVAIERHFTPGELTRNVDGWIENRLGNPVDH